MDYLLDTHTFLWFINGSEELSGKAKSAIENTKNTKFISIEWERPEMQSAFRDYIVKHYPGIAVEEVLRQVGKWPDYL